MRLCLPFQSVAVIPHSFELGALCDEIFVVGDLVDLYVCHGFVVLVVVCYSNIQQNVNPTSPNNKKCNIERKKRHIDRFSVFSF
jgi:hypothetical protein